MRAIDLEATVAAFAPDAEMHCPVGDEPYRGPEGVRRFFTAMLANLKSAEIREQFVHALETEAAVKWLMTGTTIKDRAIRLEGIDLFRFAPDGRFSALYAYWDPAELMQALE